MVLPTRRVILGHLKVELICLCKWAENAGANSGGIACIDLQLVNH